MKQKKSLFILLFLICLFHILILMFLFIYYHIPLFPDFTASTPPEFPQKEVETVFYDDWAELKPSAGSLSAYLPPEQTANNVAYDGNQEQEEIYQDSREQADDDHSDSFEEATKTPVVHEIKDFSGKKSSSAQKLKAQKTVAAITSGYLEQLKQEGTNLIKTIGGNSNKLPTELQLKYERYMAKLQWSFQNAHSIHLEKLAQAAISIKSTMKVSLSLDRAGKIIELKTVQSSGNNFVDSYIINLFQYAGSSFPPLPTYIKEDPYQCVYIIFIDWNSQSSPYVCFTRN